MPKDVYSVRAITSITLSKDCDLLATISHGHWHAVLYRDLAAMILRAHRPSLRCTPADHPREMPMACRPSITTDRSPLHCLQRILSDHMWTRSQWTGILIYSTPRRHVPQQLTSGLVISLYRDSNRICE